METIPLSTGETRANAYKSQIAKLTDLNPADISATTGHFLRKSGKELSVEDVKNKIRLEIKGETISFPDFLKANLPSYFSPAELTTLGIDPAKPLSSAKQVKAVESLLEKIKKDPRVLNEIKNKIGQDINTTHINLPVLIASLQTVGIESIQQQYLAEYTPTGVKGERTASDKTFGEGSRRKLYTIMGGFGDEVTLEGEAMDAFAKEKILEPTVEMDLRLAQALFNAAIPPEHRIEIAKLQQQVKNQKDPVKKDELVHQLTLERQKLYKAILTAFNVQPEKGTISIEPTQLDEINNLAEQVRKRMVSVQKDGKSLQNMTIQEANSMAITEIMGVLGVPEEGKNKINTKAVQEMIMRTHAADGKITPKRIGEAAKEFLKDSAFASLEPEKKALLESMLANHLRTEVSISSIEKYYVDKTKIAIKPENISLSMFLSMGLKGTEFLYRRSLTEENKKTSPPEIPDYLKPKISILEEEQKASISDVLKKLEEAVKPPSSSPPRPESPVIPDDETFPKAFSETSPATDQPEVIPVQPKAEIIAPEPPVDLPTTETRTQPIGEQIENATTILTESQPPNEIQQIEVWRGVREKSKIFNEGNPKENGKRYAVPFQLRLGTQQNSLVLRIDPQNPQRILFLDDRRESVNSDIVLKQRENNIYLDGKKLSIQAETPTELFRNNDFSIMIVGFDPIRKEVILYKKINQQTPTPTIETPEVIPTKPEAEIGDASESPTITTVPSSDTDIQAPAGESQPVAGPNGFVEAAGSLVGQPVEISNDPEGLVNPLDADAQVGKQQRVEEAPASIRTPISTSERMEISLKEKLNKLRQLGRRLIPPGLVSRAVQKARNMYIKVKESLGLPIGTEELIEKLTPVFGLTPEKQKELTAELDANYFKHGAIEVKNTGKIDLNRIELENILKDIAIEWHNIQNLAVQSSNLIEQSIPNKDYYHYISSEIVKIISDQIITLPKGYIDMEDYKKRLALGLYFAMPKNITAQLDVDINKIKLAAYIRALNLIQKTISPQNA